jgi:2-keto-4-pentenoate hydratase
VTHASVPREILAGERSLFSRMQQEASAGARRAGWKIAHAIEEVDALNGDVPVVGWISETTVLADGGEYAARGARTLRAETEIAIELARPVDPDAEDDAVLDAIAGMRVALEIVDVRRPPCDARSIIEGNVFHRAVAFGPRLSALNEPVGRAMLLVNGRVHHQDDRPPNPIAAVRGVAAMLAATGVTRLAPGDKILTGSVVHVPVSADDDLCAEIEGLDRVTARIGP